MSSCGNCSRPPSRENILVADMTTKVHYKPPCFPEKCCWNCRWNVYDMSRNEWYCKHKPLPEGLGPIKATEDGGHCDYWEKE